MAINNFKAEKASASAKTCHGCVETDSDVMLSFANITLYDGFNEPIGKLDSFRCVDLFLKQEVAEHLYKELGDCINRNKEKENK